MALPLKHLTSAQFADKFWAQVLKEYKEGNKLRYSYLIWWLYKRIQAGDITNNEARVTFNTAYNRALNNTQWTNLVSTRLLPIKDRYQSMLDEGEL